MDPGRRWRFAVLALAAAVAAVTAAEAALADSLRLDRTRPDHLGPKGGEGIEPPAPADHIYRKTDTLAYRMPQPISKWASLDPKLSHLCRLGAFHQLRPNGLYAIAGNVTYGVAFADGANLIDPQKQAKPGAVYFFSYGETSNCEVLKAQRNQLRAFSTSVYGSPAQGTTPAK